jgi:hypothetical protein
MLLFVKLYIAVIKAFYGMLYAYGKLPNAKAGDNYKSHGHDNQKSHKPD